MVDCSTSPQSCATSSIGQRIFLLPAPSYPPIVPPLAALGAIPETVVSPSDRGKLFSRRCIDRQLRLFASDEIEETCGVEVVLTNDLRMQAGDAQGFPQINERFVCMTRQLKGAYGNAALPEIMSAAELWVQLTL